MNVRRLSTPGEWRDAEDLQKKIWGFPDREVVPFKTAGVLSRWGFVTLGAFEGRKMIGFCYSQPGWKEGRPVHFSRLLGVLPRWGGRGVGARLKRRQRREVLGLGIDKIVWTVDPLQARNAALNFRKLGCISQEYVPEAYPASLNRFNRGMGSDRIEVEWPIRSRRVERILAGGAPSGKATRETAREFVLEAVRNSRGIWIPGPVRRALLPKMFLEVPRNIEEIRRQDPSAAVAWRTAVRRAFLRLFGRGYEAVAFGPPPGGDAQRFGYTLARNMEPR